MAVHRHIGKYLALIGAVALSLGFISPADADPVTSCPEGAELVAKFELTHDGYGFVDPAGNGSVVTITEIDGVPLASGAAWTATEPIGAIVVKGGSVEQPDSVAVKLVTYDPPATSGTFGNEGLVNPGGNVPDISHVLFCGPTDVETTTTSVPETTTSTTSTTSTTVPETTTTVQVEGTSATQTTAGPTTEVLGVQLVRTGFSTTMLVLGTSLLVLGLVIELLLRAAEQRAS